ncbi:MAG: hypothetical protein KKC37_09425, partial [Proteobacteria bacterium]|nr:hypothetical protein [Pseudomonadota bacterium]
MTCPQCAADNPPGAAFCAHCGASLPTPLESDSPLASTGPEDRPGPPDVVWPLSPGVVLDGRFEIGRRLGEGPVGVVWLARDRELQGKELALKVWRPELVPDVRARLIDGIIRCQTLSHSGVVKIFNLRRHGDLWFHTQAYVPGVSLDRVLAERREAGHAFSVGETARVVIGILDILQSAHGTTPHLGLKPQNVMVLGQFPEVEIKLTDFAVSGGASTPETLDGEAAPYLAPEQRAGIGRAEGDEPGVPAGPAADLFATGVMMSEMLTGHPPQAPAESPSTPAPGLSPGIDAVVARALDPDPTRRFATAGQFRHALAQAALAAVEAEMTARRQAEARQKKIAPVEPPREEPERPRVDKDQGRPPVRPPAKPGRKKILVRAGAALVLAMAVAAAVAGYVAWDDYRTKRNVKRWTTQAAAAWKHKKFRRARHLYLRLAEVRPDDRAVRVRLASR